jgi:hypothetical protein
MTSKTIKVNDWNVDDMESWELADELGQLHANMRVLKRREAQLKGELIDRGDDVEGEYHAVSLSHVRRDQTNWKLIAEKFNPSRQMIAAHTRKLDYYTVRVYDLED